MKRIGWVFAGVLLSLNLVVLTLIYWNKQDGNKTSFAAVSGEPVSQHTTFAESESSKATQLPSTDKNLSPSETLEQAITSAVPGLAGIEIYTKNKKYVVEATYTLEDGFGLEGAAKQAARDFTFAAYATGIPIARTSIQISKPDGTMGMLVTVGGKQAQTQPSSTWTNDSVGPSIFIKWVEQNVNTDYKNIENHTMIKNNF